MISSIHEDGYDWVVIDDESWAKAVVTDYINGFPIWVKRG